MGMRKSELTAMKLLICISVVFLLVLESETKAKMDYEEKLELARDHYQRVVSLIDCGVPKPRIFRVETSSMRLVPSATVLHRCGDQSGCCTKPTHKCVAKTKEKVRLYFLVKSIQRHTRRRNKIKKFVFANHTECHCIDMSYRPR